MVFRFRMTVFLLLLFQVLHSQFFYNGDFKYYRPNYKPLVWYGLDADNEFWVDTSILFNGKHSLRVRSNTDMSANSIAVYQQQDISGWEKHSTIKVSCYLSFSKGDTSNFHFFVNNNPCVAAYYNRYVSIRVDTVSRNPRTWIKMTIEKDIDTACHQIFIGFIGYSLFDFNVSSWEVFINGGKVTDIPVYPKPLPDQKDRNFLKSTALPIPDIGRFENKTAAGAFRQIIGNSRVVALGEGTHGTREFNILRTSITRYLIDSCGFNTLVFEEDPVSMMLANRALQTRSVPVTAITDSFFINVHNNDETKSLLEDLAARMMKGRDLRLKGADMQKIYWALLYMRASPLQDASFNADVSAVAAYALRPVPDWEQSYQATGRLLERFKTIRKTLPEPEREIYGEALSVLNQCVNYQARVMRGRTFLQMSREEAVLAFNYRDSCMAVNIMQLLKADPACKIIVWNHNSHVRKLPDNINAGLDARYMGEYLTDSMTGQYKAFALTTAEGTLRGAGYWRLQVDTLDRPAEDCYEYYFSQTGYASFLWPLTKGYPAITEYLRFRDLGTGRPKGVDSFRSLPLMGNYDGIFFINKTSYSKPLSKK